MASSRPSLTYSWSNWDEATLHVIIEFLFLVVYGTLVGLASWAEIHTLLSVLTRFWGQWVCGNIAPVWNIAQNQENNENAPLGKNQQNRLPKVLVIKSPSTSPLKTPSPLSTPGFLQCSQPQWTTPPLSEGTHQTFGSHTSYPLDHTHHIHTPLRPINFHLWIAH